MKTILAATLLLLVALGAGAQDTIVFRNGEKVTGKVVKVTSATVEYQRSDIPDGPVYSRGFNAVAMVIYANGRREEFTPPAETGRMPDERHRQRPERSVKNVQRQKLQGIIMTAVGTTLFTGGVATLIYGLTQVEFVPSVAGAAITAAGMPFMIVGPIKISIANRQLRKHRPVNFDTEIGFKPIAAPAFGSLGYRAGAGVSIRF